MSHRWLIAVSMTAHLCAAGALFATGAWQLERLHADKLHVDLRESLAIPAPAGGLKGAVDPKFTPKTPIAKGPVQPTTFKPKEPTTDSGSTHNAPGPGAGSGDPSSTGKCTENCGDTARKPACGDGSVDVGEQCDDANTLDGDGCSATCQIEVKPSPPLPKPTIGLPPSVLQSLRVSGDTQVGPSDFTQQQMVHDGVGKVIGTVKLCVAPDGGVATASVLRSTKYPDYDQRLLAAVQGWRYRPYSVNGVAVRACSTVTFIFQIQ